CSSYLFCTSTGAAIPRRKPFAEFQLVAVRHASVTNLVHHRADYMRATPAEFLFIRGMGLEASRIRGLALVQESEFQSIGPARTTDFNRPVHCATISVPDDIGHSFVKSQRDLSTFVIRESADRT